MAVEVDDRHRQADHLQKSVEDLVHHTEVDQPRKLRETGRNPRVPVAGQRVAHLPELGRG